MGLKMAQSVVVPDAGKEMVAPAEYQVPVPSQFSFQPMNVCPGLVGSQSPTAVDALGVPDWSRSAQSLPPFSSKMISLEGGSVVVVDEATVVLVGATVVLVGATVVVVVVVVGGGGGGGTSVTSAQLIPSFEIVASENARTNAP